MSRTASSARLGATLRSLLARPAEGFAAAFTGADRREQLGRRPAEGFAPFVFAAIGGAGAMLAWLKVGTLLGLRHVHAGHRVWAYVLMAMITGAVIAVVALLFWGTAGAALLRSLDAEASARDLRIVGGLSGIPQVAAVLVLLPLDAWLSGTATFTAQRMTAPISQGWAALSVALAMALVVWSLILLVRGMQDLTGLRLGRAAGVGAIAVVCLVVVATGVLAGAVALGGPA